MDRGLEREQIPYMVTGGLAARTRGATRPLAEIDLYVHTDALARVLRIGLDA